MVEKFMIEKFMVEKSGVEKSGVEKSILQPFEFTSTLDQFGSSTAELNIWTAELNLKKSFTFLRISV